MREKQSFILAEEKKMPEKEDCGKQKTEQPTTGTTE